MRLVFPSHCRSSNHFPLNLRNRPNTVGIRLPVAIWVSIPRLRIHTPTRIRSNA